jgi:hypothetical protein
MSWKQQVRKTEHPADKPEQREPPTAERCSHSGSELLKCKRPIGKDSNMPNGRIDSARRSKRQTYQLLPLMKYDL